jgi:hypothetical protein
MITADSELLSPPRATMEQAAAYINRRGSVYTPHDIDVIAGHYWRYCVPAGLDPLLAVAQCIHETSERDPATGKWLPLSTWWAQRPRRNPAGLGVTGEESASRPADTAGWLEDTRTQPSLWRKGLAFSSWDESTRAQIGRLLAYAIPEAQEDDAQRELIAFALGIRSLPQRMRGSAPKLKLLGAAHNPTRQGWAYPGDNYGNKIAEIARAIINTQA